MPLSAARDRILDTAFRLFYARGLKAVGVDLIIAESGVAKATFYKHFPSKDELVLAYLDKVDGVWSGQLHAAAEAAGPDPAHQLVGLFDALGSACRRDGYRGCAFINAAAEAVPGTPVHDRTVAHKREVLAWVQGLAAAAWPAGRSMPTPRPRPRPGLRPSCSWPPRLHRLTKFEICHSFGMMGA
jgi:AcrR family transcriptional regulator